MRPSFVVAFGVLLLTSPARAEAGELSPTTRVELDLEPQKIYGGTDVPPCGWPTTVSLQGSCTGTLVHPEVVIYAAHCGTGYGSIRFGENANGGSGRTVTTEYCRTYPGGGPGNGNDFAFCKLAEPQRDITIVPVLMGCETDVLHAGREVTIVGFGQADTGPYGIKRQVTTIINSVGNEAQIGGGGKDSCQGDSGGPVYVKLPAQAGVESWRVFGITSYGGACGGGGYYSLMHRGMQWFETESGIDLTPCHDADGTWNPGPDCRNFPLEPGAGGGDWGAGCDAGALGGWEAVCGPGFNSDPDDAAPHVTVAMPMQGQVFMSDPVGGQAQVVMAVDADDGAGWGVAKVQLRIDGVVAAKSDDFDVPYQWSAKFDPGVYEIVAVATDHAGNIGQSAPVMIGVDMEPPPPDPSSDTAQTGPSTDTDRDSDGPATDSAPTGQDDDAGCACTSAESPSSWAVWWSIAFVRRRRR